MTFVLFRPVRSEETLIFIKPHHSEEGFYQLLAFFSFWIFQPFSPESLLLFVLPIVM